MKTECNGNRLVFELSDKERDAASWMDLDNASLGKLVKATALLLTKADDAVTMQAIATLMATTTYRSKAETMKLTVNGVKYKGEEAGDYEILVTKKK